MLETRDAEPARRHSAVVLDVIAGQLQAIAEEMGIVMIKAAYSTNIEERRDCSAAILDARGDTVAQAEHIPLHLGSMLGIVPSIIEAYGPEGIAEGDVFVTNDPYEAGGTHLPDIALAMPVFDGGDPVAYCVTVAHHSEIGGGRGRAVDVFAEGLRIPPVKLFSGGELVDDVFRLIIGNCRVKEERRGDLRAQVAAVKLGARRIGESCARYSGVLVRGAIVESMTKAERQARASLQTVPRGRFEFTDYMDSDGAGTNDIAISVAVEITDDGISFDFSGSDPQVRGPINVVWTALYACVYYTVRAVIDKDLPANAGYYRIISIHAPEGSIVNAVEPAPVLSRSDTCQRIVDVILGALAGAMPDRVVAACNGAMTGVEFNGRTPERGPFAYMETIGGGFGARQSSDGPDAVHAHMTNSSNLSVEALELQYPLRVTRYALRTGSGGAGEFRGGLGIVRELEVLCDEVFVRTKGDRTVRGPWGLGGGSDGQPGVFKLEADGGVRTIGSQENGLRLRAGDRIRVETAGGGGFGDPGRRSAEAVDRDVREEKYSASGTSGAA
ncbi:MAG: N-methylhydantoinase [Solirubrobacteraceae bacterium]|nr:N-methylhydantoinase [Solirubrobacteraceae bacterium]